MLSKQSSPMGSSASGTRCRSFATMPAIVIGWAAMTLLNVSEGSLGALAMTGYAFP